MMLMANIGAAGRVADMTHHKIILPSKICKVCGLSFNWRKKWKLNWNEVLYCSDRCRRNKPAKGENKSRTATTPLSVKTLYFYSDSIHQPADCQLTGKKRPIGA